jgi:hypothetical protein
MTRWLLGLAALSMAPAAHADDEHATPAALAALAKAKGQPLGASKESGLESPDFVQVSVKKGYCYAVAVRLADGARWKPGRKPMLFSPAWPTNSTTIGPTLLGDTGAVYEPTCAQKSGKASLGLMTYGPDDHVGSGRFVLQVYERKPAAAELAAETRVLKKAHADAIRERDASRQKTCSQCAGESPSLSDRRICLERRGLTMSDCHF